MSVDLLQSLNSLATKLSPSSGGGGMSVGGGVNVGGVSIGGGGGLALKE
jgi:hypothetical protein